MPSACDAFTSTLFSSKTRISSAFFFSAASASGASAAALAAAGKEQPGSPTADDESNGTHLNFHGLPQIESGWKSSSTLPSLSANESRRTPTLSSSVRCRLASGVGSLYLDMAAAAHVAGGAARNDDWQINMVVNVRIAHAAAIQVEHVVQQRPVSFRSGLQLLQKLREQRDVELIDLGHLGDLFGVVAMVRQRVMRIGNADLRISPVACFSRQLKRHDARDVSLQAPAVADRTSGGRGQHTTAGTPRGRSKIRQRIFLRGRFGLLNAPFNVADRLQVLADAIAIARSKRILQASEFFDNGIEQTRPFPERGAALGGAPSPRQRDSRTRSADGLPPEVASSERTTRDCSDRRRRSRCRTGPTTESRSIESSSEGSCVSRPSSRAAI